MDTPKVKKCLFPAAGYGTRFLPATKAMPKEMLPILNKPLIQYGVEEAAAADIHQIAFVTGRNKRAIEDHFDINYEIEHHIKGTRTEDSLASIRQLIESCTFSYTRQTRMLGLGHAILTGETLIGNESFGVVLADDLCITDSDTSLLGEMIEIYEETGCSVVAVMRVRREEISQYGVIDYSSGTATGHPKVLKITDLIEKPTLNEAPSDMAIIGRYVLKPGIFDVLRNTTPGIKGEIQLTDALKVEAQNGELLAYHFTGRRFDCGTVDGFVEATQYYYKLENKKHSLKRSKSTVPV